MADTAPAVGDIVLFNQSSVDPETGEQIVYDRPAIVVQLRDNPNPPDPSMKNWCDLAVFRSTGEVDPFYSFAGKKGVSGSYYPKPAPPSEPAPAETAPAETTPTE